MIKRILLLFALLLAMAKGYAQQAAYTLPSPKGWTVEKLPIPIDFAPKIPLKGVEELRFTPGWGDSKTGEYWSYAFLWFVEGTVNLKKDTLQSYLTQYFEGLYISNQKKDVDVPGRFTRVKIKKTHTLPNDEQTFEGDIATLDFLTHEPIAFKVKVHVRNYTSTGHSAVLFEISPHNYDDVVWDKLDGVVNGFSPPAP